MWPAGWGAGRGTPHCFIHARTEGNALFMVNIVEHLVQRRLVTQRMGEWTLRPGAEAIITTLPEGLRQFLMRRIEDLQPEVRRVLEAASVVGEKFAVAGVAAGAECPVADVEAWCEALAAQHNFLEDTGLTVWPDGTSDGEYRFQHALYQQVLYEQLGTVRRRQLHQHIGTRLEAGYGAQAREIAAQLAVHFERGGETLRAVHYWQQAGDNAARRNAYHEAVTVLRKGLTLLATQPDSPERTRHELRLQLTLGELLGAVRDEWCRKWRSLHAGLRTVPASGGDIVAGRGALGPHAVALRRSAVASREPVQPGALRPDATPA